MLPFTQQQFFDVFAGYNLAIWPVQILAYFAGIFVLIAFLGRNRQLQRAGLVTVGALWMWTGAIFLMLYFDRIGPSGPIFGLPFMFQGGFFLFLGLNDGWSQRHISSLHATVGVILAVCAMFVYPLIGILAGQAYPAMPVFGITPCPLVIFTFAVLFLSPVQIPRWMFTVPLLWALVGGVASLLLHIPEDVMLPLGGLITLSLFAARKSHSSEESSFHRTRTLAST